jgi:hypothetical protein
MVQVSLPSVLILISPVAQLILDESGMRMRGAHGIRQKLKEKTQHKD